MAILAMVMVMAVLAMGGGFHVWRCGFSLWIAGSVCMHCRLATLKAAYDLKQKEDSSSTGGANQEL